MASYRVSVTYNVEVEDSGALLAAGRAAWTAPSSWSMAFDEHGAVQVGPGGEDEVELTPEASIALALGATLQDQRYPSVPGARFSGMSINAVPESEAPGGNPAPRPLRSMDVAEVDERDSSWEDGHPRFRIYLFAGEGPGHATWTYDITGADVLDVIRWAQDEAGDDRMFAVALVRDDLRHQDDVRRRGLVWIVGMDANDAPAGRVEQARRDGMWRRRGRQVVTARED